MCVLWEGVVVCMCSGLTRSLVEKKIVFAEYYLERTIPLRRWSVERVDESGSPRWCAVDVREINLASWLQFPRLKQCQVCSCGNVSFRGPLAVSTYSFGCEYNFLCGLNLTYACTHVVCVEEHLKVGRAIASVADTTVPVVMHLFDVQWIQSVIRKRFTTQLSGLDPYSVLDFLKYQLAGVFNDPYFARLPQLQRVSLSCHCFFMSWCWVYSWCRCGIIFIEYVVFLVCARAGSVYCWIDRRCVLSL